MSLLSNFEKDAFTTLERNARENAKQIAGIFRNQAGIQSFGEIAYVNKAKADFEDGECLVSGEVAVVENGQIRPVGIDETPNAIVVCSAEGLANYQQASTTDNVVFQVYKNGEDVYYINIAEGYNNEGTEISVKVVEDVSKDQLLKACSNYFTFELADTADDVGLFKVSKDAKAGQRVFAKRFYKVVE